MDFCGEPIVSQPSELLEEAHSCRFTFHSVQVEMVQHIESKCRLDPMVAGWKQLLLKKLHGLVRGTITRTPRYPMLEYACSVRYDYLLLPIMIILLDIAII